MSNPNEESEVLDRIILATPKKWNVVFYNDDKTPVDFVIAVLIEQYNHSIEKAKEITLSIHEKGKGIAGTYYLEIAEQKCNETIKFARKEGFPLQVDIEKIK